MRLFRQTNPRVLETAAKRDELQERIAISDIKNLISEQVSFKSLLKKIAQD